jgi:hypothetical protein
VAYDTVVPHGRPFNWKYTAADLAGLLWRVSEHNQAAAMYQIGPTASA